MDISFFRRGITLPRSTAVIPVEEIPAPSRAAILLKQEAGPPCAPVVAVGDKVVAGQKVAAGASGGADLHASIGGEVRAIEEYRLPDGTSCRAVVIEDNGEKAKGEKAHLSDPLQSSPEELLERIRAAGVVRAGREAKSLATVIAEATASRGYLAATGSKITKPVQHLVVRFCDQDPYLYALESFSAALKNTADLKLGIQALNRIVKAQSVCFVLGKKQSAPAVESLAGENDYSLVRIDATNYPALDDSLVARAVAGKEPEVSFKRVHESGVLIVDVPTVVEVCRAVRDSAPVIDEVLTVRGPRGAQVVRARIGTLLSDIIKSTGQSGKIGKIVLGGPMRGQAHHTLDFPLYKGIEALTLLNDEDVTRAENSLCIGCGLCSEVCPMRLIPGMLSRYCEFGKWEAADQAHLFSCIECGACAYVCPAGRSIVQLVTQGKSEVLATHGGGNNA